MKTTDAIEAACRAFFGDVTWDAPTDMWRDGKRIAMGRALQSASQHFVYQEIGTRKQPGPPLSPRFIAEHYVEPDVADDLAAVIAEQVEAARREGWEQGILWMRDKVFVAQVQEKRPDADLDEIANALIAQGPPKP